MMRFNQSMSHSYTPGDMLKDEGVEAVKRANAEFVDFMRGEASRISNEKGWVCSDDLRVIADREGLSPSHPNAWGSIFSRNGWKCIGYMKSMIPSNHSRLIAKWIVK